MRRLSSPRLALALLGATALYAVGGSFGPTVVFGAHPFSSPVFIVLVVGVFLSTFACTWRRSAVAIGLLGGRLPASAVTLEGGVEGQLLEFLERAGFKGTGAVLWHWRPALVGGWLLHVALLILIAGVGIQLTLYDQGLFEVAVGESVDLQSPGVVFDRQTGVFAADAPPAIQVALLSFDPYRHQRGYAPDRISTILVMADGVEHRRVLDRAEGAAVAGTKLYQSLVTGMALVAAMPGGDHRALHLASVRDNLAYAELTDRSGGSFTIEVESDAALGSVRGTGPLSFRLRRGDRVSDIALGDAVDIAGGPARLVGVARWSGFSYSRSPGMPAVISGFSLVLAAMALLIFPAGFARISDEGGGVVARVWSTRGLDVLVADWGASSARREARGEESEVNDG